MPKCAFPALSVQSEAVSYLMLIRAWEIGQILSYSDKAKDLLPT